MINSINKKFFDVSKKLFAFLDNYKFIISIFVIIFILYYFMCDVIAMYFDDFGNASLSYSYTVPNVSGTNYNSSQLLEWAGQIYNHFGGRIFCAIAFIIPLLKNGIGAYMFVQSLILTGIIFFIYKIIKFYSKDNKYISLIPIIAFLLYCLIDMSYLRHGIYWASASVLYVWPLLPFFSLIYLYINVCEKIKKEKKYNRIGIHIVLCLLSFLTSFSQEQFGIGLLCFEISFILFHHLKKIKSYISIDIPLLVTTIVSYLFLFLAPGNWQRMLEKNLEFSNMSIIEKISTNFPNFIKNLFFNEIHIFIYIMCMLVFFMSYRIIIYKKDSKIKRIFFIVPALLVNLYIIFQVYLYNENHFHQTIFLILGSIWFINLFVLSIIYFSIKKKIEFCSLLVGGFSSILCLLMSPVLGGRTYLPFIFFAILFITKILHDILNDSKFLKFIFALFFVFLLRLSIINYYTIYQGYRDNYSIHKLNDSILRNYNKNSNDNKIELYKVENVWYGSTMSYEEPSMDYWIKEYYDLPQSVQFEWRDIYEKIR